MRTPIENPYRFHLELRSRPDASGTPLHHEVITDDLPDLVAETYVRGVVGGVLPADPSTIRCEITPLWDSEPVVKEIEIELTAEVDGEQLSHAGRYSAGSWVRRSVPVVLQLRKEQTIGENESAYPVIFAEKNGRQSSSMTAPDLEAPPIVDQSLEDFGVRSLGEGSLVPDRPILFNHRSHEEVIERCMAAGAEETGGAMLGVLIRLPEALPGTTTRVVTVLSASVVDSRHVGSVNEMAFNPEALVEASDMAELRDKGERVISVVHSHGWGCGRCNEQQCPLAQSSYASPQDYQLIESLFPCKSSVLPIAGRKLGAPSGRPVLEIHAWRGGQLRPVRWQHYHD